MSARRKPPSMLELCHFFRKKKELMWKEDSEDSERQNISSYGRTVGRGTTSQLANSAVALPERNAIATSRDPPLRLTQAGYSNEVYDSRISSSYSENKKSWYYVPVKKTSYAARFPLLNESTESLGIDRSSDEEYRFLEDGDLSDSRIGQLHSPVGCLEEDNIQAANRNRYDEMSLPQREVEKRIKKMPQDRRRDSRSVYPQNPANTRRYSSLHQASTEGYSYNQIQDEKEKRSSSRTVKTFVKNGSIQQHREMGPTRRRNGFCGREILPPIQQDDMVTVPLPRLLKTEEQHRHHRHHLHHRGEVCEPPIQQDDMVTVPLPRLLKTEERHRHHRHHLHHRGEVCEERNLFGSRRNGVCQETDETRQHRTFVRVLSKRF